MMMLEHDPIAPAEPIWQKVRVLVVEDDSSTRRLLVMALRRMQLWDISEIVEASTLRDAELRLMAGPRFDVVILDLELPNGRGVNVISKLSRVQAYPPCIIVLTGLEMDIASQVAGIREGAHSWVCKSDLYRPGGYLDWTPLQRAIGYSLARRDWLGPMLIERARRIAAEGVNGA